MVSQLRAELSAAVRPDHQQVEAAARLRRSVLSDAFEAQKATPHLLQTCATCVASIMEHLIPLSVLVRFYGHLIMAWIAI